MKRFPLIPLCMALIAMGLLSSCDSDSANSPTNSDGGSAPVTATSSVSAPAFSPAGGTYTAAQSVTLAAASGAAIYYTTDGSKPTKSSMKYSGAFTVSANRTIQAIALRNDTSSTVSSATYTISGASASITYGSLTDARDGQAYKTVTIGTQTWMAENLNFNVDSSWCYANSTDSCSKYGRLYQWAAVMGLNVSYNSILWSGTVSSQGVCPSGWHVPSDAEWAMLVEKNGDEDATAGVRLKSKSGWSGAGYSGELAQGGDAYGFRALPGGGRNESGAFEGVGSNAYFWTSREIGDGFAINKILGSAFVNFPGNGPRKTEGFSVRCIQGAAPQSTVDTVATPGFSPAGGTYSTTQSVAISSATAGAIIYYTTNGSTPTTSSKKYASPVAVNKTQTLKAIAFRAGMMISNVGSAAYSISVDTVAAPVFSPPGGSFSSGQLVAISSTTSGASIFYTVDGTIPTIRSKQCTSLVAVSTSLTLAAIAVKSGMATSPFKLATFTMSIDSTVARIPWMPSINYGVLTYGGQTYKTVTIGTQTWMAENLNYAVDRSWRFSFDGDTTVFRGFGRLYQWSAAMGLDSNFNDAKWSGTLPRQGVCPSGWHLPSDAEWTTLVTCAGGEDIAGRRLKSMSGWSTYDFGDGSGTDFYGFRAIPGGYRNLSFGFSSGGVETDFWSSSEGGISDAWGREILSADDTLDRHDYDKEHGLSVRCLKD
jgi:uncharacterized protein (TIGR02145 family)